MMECRIQRVVDDIIHFQICKIYGILFPVALGRSGEER